MSVVYFFSLSFNTETPVNTDFRSSSSFLMAKVLLATTSCRIYAARPSDLGKYRHLRTMYLISADTRCLLQNAGEQCHSTRCHSVRLVLRRTCVAWPGLRRTRRTMRPEILSHPLLSSRHTRKRSIRCVCMLRDSRLLTVGLYHARSNSQRRSWVSRSR